MRKSFIIYAEWADQILNLPNELAGEYAKAILKYGIYGEKDDDCDPVIHAMLIPVFKRIDLDTEAWEEAKRQRSEGGKKGMANRWHNSVISKNNSVISEDNTVIADNNSVTEDITPITVNVNVNDNVLKKKNNKKKKGTFYNFPERDYDYAELKAGVDHV